jgi:UPF0755 protein
MVRYLIAIFLVGAVAALTLLNLFGQPVNSADTGKTEFVVNPGQSLDQIADNLSREKLIRSRAVFKMTVFRYNLAKKIQAGYFYLSRAESTAQIARGLTKAQAKQVWVTIPEGLRREEVANTILDQLVAAKIPHRFDPEEFIRSTVKLEGHLFPETYAFDINVTTAQVIEKLTNQFDSVISSLEISPDKVNSVITLASLVEREAGQDSEREEIASIISKRVTNKWALQVDATVQYAIASSRCRIRICDWWSETLTRADLAIASPYNTYVNPGLPPAPIGNPGLSSLKAAASPRSTKNWFYLHDPNGTVHYAETIEQHNQNVCAYLKKDC